MNQYKIEAGIEMFPLESKTITARNLAEAEAMARKLLLDPSKGYAFIRVKRIKKK